MNTVVQNTFTGNESGSQFYAGHYGGLDAVKRPRFATVIGRDGQDYGRPSEPPIHVNIKMKPYSHKDPKRLERLMRFSHMFAMRNLPGQMELTPSDASIVFPLEEMNFRLHQMKLKWLEDFPNDAARASQAGQEAEPNPKWCAKHLTYLGVLNTESNVPMRHGGVGLEKTGVIITQGSTNIPNAFRSVDEYNNQFIGNSTTGTHWRLFFTVKEKCLTAARTYCYDPLSGPVTLPMPSDNYVTEILPVASQKQVLTLYDYDEDGVLIEPTENNIKIDQTIYYRGPGKYKSGYSIPFGMVEFNDVQNRAAVLPNTHIDCNNYQRCLPMKVWMRATF